MLLARNRNFRLLFSASAVSNLADGISALAFPWLASLLTRDPVLIAAVAAAARLPWLLFTAPAGVIIDRQDRQALMVWADAARMAAMAAVLVLVLRVPDLAPLDENAVYLWTLAILAFGLGTAEVLRDNAAQTALPQLVETSDLEVANGQLWSIEQIMGSLIGPPLAGVLIALAVPLPFAVDAVAFAMAALCVSLIAFPARQLPTMAQGFWADLRDGVLWLLRHKTILRLAILLGCINGLSAGYMTLYVLFAQDILGLSAAQYGLLLTAPAVGGVIGGLIGPHLVQRFGGQAVFLAAQGLFVLTPLTFSFSSNPFLVALVMATGMFAAVSYNVVTVSYRQRRIPDAILGRVNALFRLLGWGSMPIGMMLAGAAVAAFEPSLGRELALRLPFLLASIGLSAMLVYATLAIRLR